VPGLRRDYPRPLPPLPIIFYYMTQDLHYIPLAHVEAEVATVRRYLQKFARQQLSRQGGITTEISEAEITAELETYVPEIVHALHRSPLYPQIKRHGRRQLEGHISQIIEQIS
jgi:hypothetical protein